MADSQTDPDGTAHSTPSRYLRVSPRLSETPEGEAAEIKTVPTLSRCVFLARSLHEYIGLLIHIRFVAAVRSGDLLFFDSRHLR